MPNRAGTAARRAAKAAATIQSEDAVHVNAVHEVAGFKIEALGNYEFTRQGAGRKREPSPYDDVVENLVGQTSRIPVKDADEAASVIKDLQKATEFRNRGLEKRVEEFEDVGLAVVFKVNESKAKRSPRKAKEEDGTPDASGAETE